MLNCNPNLINQHLIMKPSTIALAFFVIQSTASKSDNATKNTEARQTGISGIAGSSSAPNSSRATLSTSHNKPPLTKAIMEEIIRDAVKDRIYLFNAHGRVALRKWLVAYVKHNGNLLAFGQYVKQQDEEAYYEFLGYVQRFL